MFVQSGKYQNSVNGDQGATSLIYIPTKDELQSMPFESAENRDAFEAFIESDKYLSTHRGQYSERGGAVAPWRHLFNVKYERTYKFHGGESISFGIDVKNVANLIYRGWGNIQRIDKTNILRLNGNGTESNPYTYTFLEPTWAKYASTYSTWSAALNLRLNF